MKLDAVIFDMDGTITDTALGHLPLLHAVILILPETMP